jgi:site-specific recombinase XerD
MLLYSSGLRVSEISHLKITDIDSKNMRIKVVQGKGAKDRYTLLSQQVLLELELTTSFTSPKNIYSMAAARADLSVYAAFNTWYKKRSYSLGLTVRIIQYILFAIALPHTW